MCLLGEQKVLVLPYPAYQCFSLMVRACTHLRNLTYYETASISVFGPGSAGKKSRSVLLIWSNYLPSPGWQHKTGWTGPRGQVWLLVPRDGLSALSPSRPAPVFRPLPTHVTRGLTTCVRIIPQRPRPRGHVTQSLRPRAVSAAPEHSSQALHLPLKNLHGSSDTPGGGLEYFAQNNSSVNHLRHSQGSSRAVLWSVNLKCWATLMLGTELICHHLCSFKKHDKPHSTLQWEGLFPLCQL